MKLNLTALLISFLILFFGCKKEDIPSTLASPELSEFKIENKKIGQPPFVLKKPVSASNGAIIFATKDSTLISISGDTVTLKASGKCTIYAVQLATQKYHADTISASFLITDSLSANLSDFPALSKRLGEIPFTLTAPKSNHNGAFTFYTSDTAIATINGRTVTLKRAGKCIITAEQAANGDYKKTGISAELTIAPKLSALITPIVFPVKMVGDPEFSFEPPTSTSTGRFSYSSSNLKVARIVENKIEITGAGKTSIIITQAEAGIYKTTSITVELTVIENPSISTVQDVDGNTYTTVKIGTQTWMAENLRTKHYRDGSPISHLKTNSDWINMTSGAFCFYDNDEKYIELLGNLYNKAATTDSRQLAPKGWHIPSKEEWEVLYQYIGGTRESGSLLQEADTRTWQASNASNNSTLFSGRGAGYRLSDGTFESYRFDAVWWSTGNVPYYNLYSKGYFAPGPLVFLSVAGCSIRCIKD